MVRFGDAIHEQLGLLLVAPLRDSLLATEKLVNIGLKIGLKSGAEQILSTYREFLRGIPVEVEQFNNSGPVQIDDGPFGNPMEKRIHGGRGGAPCIAFAPSPRPPIAARCRTNI